MVSIHLVVQQMNWTYEGVAFVLPMEMEEEAELLPHKSFVVALSGSL